MKINPCPNPKCITYHPLRPSYASGPTLAGLPTFNAGDCPYIRCSCGMQGPAFLYEDEAIAAWNSISMGWINAKDKEPPRDGTMFIAMWIKATDPRTDRFVDGIYFAICDRDGARLLLFALGQDGNFETYCHPDFWMPIPPTPEGK